MNSKQSTLLTNSQFVVLEVDRCPGRTAVLDRAHLSHSSRELSRPIGSSRVDLRSVRHALLDDFNNRLDSLDYRQAFLGLGGASD